MGKIFTSDGEYNKIYIYFAHGLQLLMLIIFCYGAIATRKNQDHFMILKLVVMGLFAFFLVWETTSRYLLNYLPMFAILMVYLIDQIVIDWPKNGIMKKLKVKKKIPEKRKKK